MQAFAFFNDKYLRPCGCSETNLTATVNCANRKTEILSEIIEVKIIGIQLDILFLS